MRQEIVETLREKAEEKYKAFNLKLIPGVKADRALGVRLPDLRQLAKEIARGDFRSYLKELEGCKKDPEGVGGTVLYYEEIMLQGILIGSAKMELDERLSYMERFVPRIDNWAVCDSSCTTLKLKKEERERFWAFLQPYLEDDREFFVRFGVIMILVGFVDDEHIDRILAGMEKISHPGYYVKMGVAWTLSVCYIRFPEKTERLIKDNAMDDFTHNKTIQKIRESNRVTKEDKDRLNQLKRKGKKQ